MSEYSKSSEESDKKKKEKKATIKKKDDEEKSIISDEDEIDKEKQKNKSKKKKSAKISIYLDGEELEAKKYDLTLSLSDLRMKLDDKINKTSLFVNKKGKYIDLDDEDNLDLSEVLKENILNLKTKVSIIKNEKEKEGNIQNYKSDKETTEIKDSKSEEPKNEDSIDEKKEGKKMKKEKIRKEKHDEEFSSDEDKKIKKKKKTETNNEEDSSDDKVVKKKKKTEKKKKKETSDEEDSSNEEEENKKTKRKKKIKKEANDEEDSSSGEKANKSKKKKKIKKKYIEEEEEKESSSEEAYKKSKKKKKKKNETSDEEDSSCEKENKKSKAKKKKESSCEEESSNEEEVKKSKKKKKKKKDTRDIDDSSNEKDKKAKKKKKAKKVETSEEEDSSGEEKVKKGKKKKKSKKKYIDEEEEEEESSSEERNKKSKKKNKKKTEQKKEFNDTITKGSNELEDKFPSANISSNEMTYKPAPVVKKKNIPLPDCPEVDKIGDLTIYFYKSVELSDEEKSQAITIMVVGETGTGKTTLLNCFLNYLLDIELTDKFRYKIIHEDRKEFGGQHKSQTSKVTTYNIRRANGNPIIIVDTPGFGDTGGIDVDMRTVSLIKDCFTKDISTINAVCFVTKASTNRLTESQKYVFDSVLNLFGNDIKENFVIMITFCDGADPQIVEALQSEDSIFKDIIQYLDPKEWYLEFNNSAFFNKNTEKANIKMYWELGIESYEKFTRKIEKLPAKSLTLSKQVLEERAKLENSVSNLTPQLDNALNIMNTFKTTIQQVEKLKGDVNDNKNFEIEIDEYYTEQIDLSGKSVYTTTCLKCNFTCHKNCCIPDDSEKRDCCAISGDYCTECPGKCHWKQHKNVPYILEKKKRKVKKTLDNLKKAYCDSNNKLNAKQQILNGLENDFNIQMLQCMSLQNQVQTAVERLKEIALNKRTHESSGQYIDQLIQSEKMQKKEGYLERIESLNELKKKHGLISSMFKRQENKAIKDLNQFTKEYIDNQKNKNKTQLKALSEKKGCLIF